MMIYSRNPLLTLSPFSSLLIVYEGAEDSILTPMDSMEACCSLENCCVDSDDLAKLAADTSSTTDGGASQESKETCCYDADASRDSTDVGSGHEDHVIESHMRNRRRQQSQHQQINNDCRRVVAETGKAFIPLFSEETMFCDSNDMAPPHSATQSAAAISSNVDTSSPVSSDSWMNYSSHSSDDYSFLMDPNRAKGRARGSSGDADAGDTSGRDSVESASIVPKNKRNRESFQEDNGHAEEAENVVPSGRHGDEETSCHQEDHEDEEDHDDDDEEEDEEDNESVDETLAHLQINNPKRLRGKEPEDGVVGGGGLSSVPTSGRSGGKSVNSSRRSSTNSQQLVDIRIIDFAHTAFVKKNSMLPPSQTQTAIHKGPDCGFITGLDSLKRLLLEILPEGEATDMME